MSVMFVVIGMDKNRYISKEQKHAHQCELNTYEGDAFEQERCTFKKYL